MKCIAIVGSLLSVGVIVGCGSSSDNSGAPSASAGSSSGGSSSGGSSGTGAGGGGTSGGAGTTTSGGHGGSPALGGAGGAPPAGVPGYPTGAIVQCLGDACPMGQCGFLAGVACATAYPDEVNPSSTYCTPSETGGYCLEVASDADVGSLPTYFTVACANGTATVMKCGDGCRSSVGGYKCLAF